MEKVIQLQFFIYVRIYPWRKKCLHCLPVHTVWRLKDDSFNHRNPTQQTRLNLSFSTTQDSATHLQCKTHSGRPQGRDLEGSFQNELQQHRDFFFFYFYTFFFSFRGKAALEAEINSLVKSVGKSISDKNGLKKVMCSK